MGEHKEEVVVLLNLTRVNRYTGALEILLQKRAKGGRFSEQWTSACVGHYELSDSSPERTMVREAHEELGLKLSKDNLKMVAVKEMPGEYSKKATYVMYALRRSLSQEPILCEPHRCEQLRWVPYEEAMELVWQHDPRQVSLMKAVLRAKMFMDIHYVLKQHLRIREWAARREEDQQSKTLP